MRLMDSDARRISVVGCNGSGKDWTTARIVLWWVHRFAPGDGYRYGADAAAGGGYRVERDKVRARQGGGYVSGEDAEGAVRDRREDFRAGVYIEFAVQDSGVSLAEAAGGHHEAHALPDDYYHAVKRLNPTKLLMTGNPFTNSGFFYDSHHRNRHLWEDGSNRRG